MKQAKQEIPPGIWLPEKLPRPRRAREPRMTPGLYLRRARRAVRVLARVR